MSRLIGGDFTAAMPFATAHPVDAEEIARRWNAHSVLVRSLRACMLNDRGLCWGCFQQPESCLELCRFHKMRAELRAVEVHP